MKYDFDLDHIKSLWEISGPLNFVRKVANSIYHSPSTNTYIRITENTHRSLKQIESELHWMNYVRLHGINTPEVLNSINLNQVETVKLKNHTFHIVCFTNAEGNRQKLNNDCMDFYYKWGEMTAKLHTASQNYTTAGLESRPTWFEDELNLNIVNIRQENDGPIYKKSLEIEEKLKLLPISRSSFGLIHADLHTGNFNIDSNGEITLFDFDDSIYSWFIFDIAIIFWSLQFSQINQELAKNTFMKGYEYKQKIDPLWLTYINDFYAYRVLQIYYFSINEIEKSDFKLSVIESFRSSLDSTYKYFNLSQNNKRQRL